MHIDGRYLKYCSKIFHHLQISLHIAGDFGLFIWEFEYRLLNSILNMFKKSRYLFLLKTFPQNHTMILRLNVTSKAKFIIF